MRPLQLAIKEFGELKVDLNLWDLVHSIHCAVPLDVLWLNSR